MRKKRFGYGCIFMSALLVIKCGVSGGLQLPRQMIPPPDTLNYVHVSTIGGDRDKTIPSPGRSPKQPLPGMGLHGSLRGRQVCPEFISFYQGFGRISLQERLFSCRPLPKRGNVCDIPSAPNR